MHIILFSSIGAMRFPELPLWPLHNDWVFEYMWGRTLSLKRISALHTCTEEENLLTMWMTAKYSKGFKSSLCRSWQKKKTQYKRPSQANGAIGPGSSNGGPWPQRAVAVTAKFVIFLIWIQDFISKDYFFFWTKLTFDWQHWWWCTHP